jgi:NADPH-dependent 2,4-dienoyl-CoA reductase/sulfur reductase-like enzyme
MNQRNIKIIAGIAVALMFCSAGWQIGKWELASIELRDDMRDMASQLGGRIGLTSPMSDEDFRNEVMRKARKYDIELAPEQVTVVRNGQGVEARMYFAADYTVPIQLPGFSFHLHFTPESGKKPA